MVDLPNEILIDSFSLIALDAEEPPTSIGFLSQVTASLWSRVVITSPIVDSQLAFTSLALTRSGDLPFTLLLDCRDPEWDWEEDEDSHHFQGQDMHRVVDLVRPHIARLRSLDVLSDTWLPIHTFLERTATTSPPVLERLSLSRCNAYLAVPGQPFYPTELRAPIRLFGGMANGCLTDVDVMPSLQQFATILQQCPDLYELSIIGWGPTLDLETTMPTAAISAPSVQKFAFGFIETSYSSALLSAMDLPSVNTLSLEDVSRTINCSNDKDGGDFLSWISTSQAAARASFAGEVPRINPLPLREIQDLQLDSFHATEAQFTRFFQCFPNLTRLSCHDAPDDALRVLVPKLSHSDQKSVACICPRLSRLHIEDADPGLLTEVVLGRTVCGIAVPLEDVTVEFVRSPRPSYSSEAVHHLERSGICVLGCQSDTDGSESD
ncbi:hypothetical protein BKA70DRAFT_1514363 [Coprinopsis sp. MPI-PUGE-AT-0042]|nr:hypothetical protein BKA70DRAFT_1514363 [Coprinopsis sp. MPI-PUGE-AT-0042]